MSMILRYLWISIGHPTTRGSQAAKLVCRHARATELLGLGAELQAVVGRLPELAWSATKDEEVRGLDFMRSGEHCAEVGGEILSLNIFQKLNQSVCEDRTRLGSDIALRGRERGGGGGAFKPGVGSFK
jgi:hypothetical protein